VSCKDEEECFPMWNSLVFTGARMQVTYSIGKPLHRLIPNVFASDICQAFDRMPILRTVSSSHGNFETTHVSTNQR
jgi:hypothetical protein